MTKLMNLLRGREESVMEKIRCRNGLGEMRGGKKGEGMLVHVNVRLFIVSFIFSK
jgi:hypothetical protein